MFGCDLQNHFDGTFFRFPLRPKHLAKDSEISNVSYGPEAVGELLDQFRASAERFLLFLRHVR